MRGSVFLFSMNRKLFLPSKTVSDAPKTNRSLVMLENVCAALHGLAIEIDNTLDDDCIVGKLRQAAERKEQLDPEDVMLLLQQIRDRITNAQIVLVEARTQISKRR